MIIAVEGADKAGKHTQVVKTVNYMQEHGIPTETKDFPQYDTPTGKEIQKVLNGEIVLSAEESMELFAKNREEQMPQINEWIQAGKWVLFDRFSYSNVAYYAAKHPQFQWQEKIAMVENIEFNKHRICRPDLNIYLSLPAVVSYEMRNQGLKPYQNGKPDINERNLLLLQNVADVYKMIAARDPKNWVVINEIKPDGTRMNPDEVFACIRPFLDNLILSKSR